MYTEQCVKLYNVHVGITVAVVGMIATNVKTVGMVVAKIKEQDTIYATIRPSDLQSNTILKCRTLRAMISCHYGQTGQCQLMKRNLQAAYNVAEL